MSRTPRTRRHFTAQQKSEVVRRHLAGKEAASDLAEESGVQPSQVHLWVKQVLDQLERAFERSGRRPRNRSHVEIALPMKREM